MANQRWYLRLQVWVRQCGMLGHHKKGQCSTEGSVMASSEGRQWSSWRGGSGEGTPAQHIQFCPLNHRESQVFHLVVTGLWMAFSRPSPCGTAEAEASSRKKGGDEERKTRKSVTNPECEWGRGMGSGLGLQVLLTHGTLTLF